MNCVALSKHDGEHWVFWYDSEVALQHIVNEYAADKDLSFTWWDALNVGEFADELARA